MPLPKWTDERTDTLTNYVGNESPVSQGTVARAAEELETTTRSISSKLRKMGYEVQLASASSTRAFTDEQEAILEAFVTENSGTYTYAEIAEHYQSGAFSAKSIQGKILSMELTDHVKPAPVKESVRTYSPEEEETFIEMVNDGAFVEAIADAMGRSVNSVRGKALSLLRSGDIDAIPRQEHTKTNGSADPFADMDVTGMTVEAIAEEIGKTPRGVKTMLTRRGISASDYDGAAKAAKAG
tara:strand:- start:561 stop:1280 length:720 start_codon:yes stop_codon:yes gene_type:complete